MARLELMIAVLQRASAGRVTVENRVTGEIGTGLVILLGVAQGDTEADAEFLADRIAGFRIFNDAEEKMNRSIRDVAGSALVISQFTLLADTSAGHRPSFTPAAPAEVAKPLYEHVVQRLQGTDGIGCVKNGMFGQHMQVELINDGPVTIMLERAPSPPHRQC